MDEVAKAIGEMTAEVRSVGTRLDRLESTLSKSHDALDIRVKSLELWRSFLAGAALICGGAIGWLFNR